MICGMETEESTTTPAAAALDIPALAERLAALNAELAPEDRPFAWRSMGLTLDMYTDV